MRQLTLPDGRRFDYVARGDGPSTLLVHPGGPGLTHEYLANLLELGGRRRRVVLFHPRGVGRSFRPRSPREYTLRAMADDVDAIRRCLHLDRFDLFGFSAGGFVAIEYARRYARHLRSLVLGGTAASAADLRAANRVILRAADPADLRRLHALEAVAAFDRPVYQRLIERIERPFQLRFLRRRPSALVRSQINPQVYHAVITRTGNEFVVDGTMARWDARPALRRLRLPALVVVGRHDFLYFASIAIARRIPGARLAVIPRASHLANLEQPRHFRRILASFLDRVDRLLPAEDADGI
jgi:proline-specific peptidase